MSCYDILKVNNNIGHSTNIQLRAMISPCRTRNHSDHCWQVTLRKITQVPFKISVQTTYVQENYLNIIYPVQQALAEKNVVRVDRWLKASLNDCISTFRFVFVRITALVPSSFPEYLILMGQERTLVTRVAVFRARMFFIYSCRVFVYIYTSCQRKRDYILYLKR